MEFECGLLSVLGREEKRGGEWKGGKFGLLFQIPLTVKFRNRRQAGTTDIAPIFKRIFGKPDNPKLIYVNAESKFRGFNFLPKTFIFFLEHKKLFDLVSPSPLLSLSGAAPLRRTKA